MAALAGAGAFGGGDKPKGPPPPVASKPRVWKRPEQPVVADEAGGAGEDHADRGESSGAGATAAVPSESVGHVSESQGTPTGGDEQVPQGEDEDEEKREKERRAAIAARMAKLGGRGVMGMPMGIGMPMGGAAKPPVAHKPEMEHSEEADVVASEGKDDSETKNAPEEPSASAPPEEQAPVGSTATTVPALPSAPATSIAMPAIPRKAGPPRRKPPTRTDTGGSGISGAASPVGARDDGSAPNLQSGPSQQPSALTERESCPIQRDDVPSPTTEGDDREIPLPKTEEELAREREYEEAGRGPRGAEGAERAGIALASVGGTVQGEAGRKETPLPAPVHHERSLPPPPPPAADDEDFGEPDADEDEDEDEDANDDIMKQAASGGLLAHSTDASAAQVAVDTAQPVGFQPLQSPAPSTSALPESTPAAQTMFSPPSAPQNLLGVPKDEVEMKNEGQVAEDTEDTDAPPPPPRMASGADEGERIKPAGPRPLPPSPARASTLPPSSSGVPQESAHEDDVSGHVEAGAPVPKRQASVRASPQVGVPVASGEESLHSPVQREFGRLRDE